MLETVTYTKEELAKLLKLSAARDGNIRTDVIIRKLKNLGYDYYTSGRGETYRIHVKGGLPAANIGNFIQKHFGISSNIEKLSHFLYLLFISEESSFYVNLPPSSLQWKTHSCNDTLQKWIEALIEQGLLIVNENKEIFYATHKLVLEEDKESGDYIYTKEVKMIKEEDYKRATRAYDYVMEDMRGIDENPELARGEIYYHAAINKLRVLDGWWAMKAKREIIINRDWEFYDELIELLRNYVFEPFEKRAHGNYVEEQEELRKKEAQWEQERAEKRMKIAAAAKELEEKQKEAETEKLLKDISTKKLKSFDLVEPTEDIGEFLVSLYKNYVSKGDF